MDKDILVDGYNVIQNNLMFQSLVNKHFGDARELLIQQLKNRYRHTMFRVIVVFDGNGPREQVRYDEHIRIIFSRQGETADQVIARLTSEAHMSGRIVEMYSDDQEVRNSVLEQGGSIGSTKQLTRNLTAAPHDMYQRSRHRQIMRRLYGIDPTYKDDNEESIHVHLPVSHKKKKKSSRRYRT